jgi:gamma-glutamyl hercynylcysteine S-oxide synthase
MPMVQNGVGVAHPLLERVVEARRQSDALFQIVPPDSMFERPIPKRHRIIFYLGHLEAFDWNLLHEDVLGLNSFHPEFDRLFAFGIDPVDGGLPSDQVSEWPALAEVCDYGRKIRTVIDQQLSAGNLAWDAPAGDGFPLQTLLNVAIEHRLMHVETLAYMLHQLPADRKLGVASPPVSVKFPLEHRMIEIPAGSAVLGLPRDGDGFGWDNEFEAHPANVPRFEIDRYMVTNQQFLAFLNSGGYQTRSFWSPDDWDWKNASGVRHPVFRKRQNDSWLYRTMFGQVALPLDWPVYVSHAEASAYARWAGKALPTEEQWHRAAYGAPDGRQRDYPWGRYAPDPSLGNFDLTRWDPAPVHAHPGGKSAFGVEGLLGNGWEWTASIFAPFTGFQPFPFYPGYSANFFDGKHFVMKGGSTRTAACMLRPTFRNWFQAHYQYVYAGFRCVNV